VAAGRARGGARAPAPAAPAAPAAASADAPEAPGNARTSMW
jgi:hypothetical protein